MGKINTLRRGMRGTGKERTVVNRARNARGGVKLPDNTTDGVGGDEILTFR